MRLDKSNFCKFEFVAKVQVIRIQTFKKSIIQSAFKRTKLIFYNLEVIFQQVYIVLNSTWAIILSLSNPI